MRTALGSCVGFVNSHHTIPIALLSQPAALNATTPTHGSVKSHPAAGLEAEEEGWPALLTPETGGQPAYSQALASAERPTRPPFHLSPHMPDILARHCDHTTQCPRPRDFSEYPHPKLTAFSPAGEHFCSHSFPSEHPFHSSSDLSSSPESVVSTSPAESRLSIDSRNIPPKFRGSFTPSLVSTASVVTTSAAWRRRLRPPQGACECLRVPQVSFARKSAKTHSFWLGGCEGNDRGTHIFKPAASSV